MDFSTKRMKKEKKEPPEKIEEYVRICYFQKPHTFLVKHEPTNIYYIMKGPLDHQVIDMCKWIRWIRAQLMGQMDVDCGLVSYKVFDVYFEEKSYLIMENLLWTEEGVEKHISGEFQIQLNENSLYDMESSENQKYHKTLTNIKEIPKEYIYATAVYLLFAKLHNIIHPEFLLLQDPPVVYNIDEYSPTLLHCLKEDVNDIINEPLGSEITKNTKPLCTILEHWKDVYLVKHEYYDFVPSWITEHYNISEEEYRKQILLRIETIYSKLCNSNVAL